MIVTVFMKLCKVFFKKIFNSVKRIWLRPKIAEVKHKCNYLFSLLLDVLHNYVKLM